MPTNEILADYESAMDQIYSGLRSGEIRLRQSQIYGIVDFARRRVTHALRTLSQAHHLDNESLYDTDSDHDTMQAVEPVSDPEYNNINYQACNLGPPLIRLKMFKTVGRATSYRRRVSDFTTRSHFDPDATARSQAANHRAAVTAATDFAKHQDLGCWVTLTFREGTEHLNPAKEFRRFIRNLTGRLKRIDARKFHYVGVAVAGPERIHCHVLLPRWIQWDLIADCWEHGTPEIAEIHPEEIPIKINYMGNNIKNSRITHARFISSKGGRPIAEFLDAESHEQARQLLENDLAPTQVWERLTQAFVRRGVVSYIFDPVADPPPHV